MNTCGFSFCKDATGFLGVVAALVLNDLHSDWRTLFDLESEAACVSLCGEDRVDHARVVAVDDSLIASAACEDHAWAGESSSLVFIGHVQQGSGGSLGFALPTFRLSTLGSLRALADSNWNEIEVRHQES